MFISTCHDFHYFTLGVGSCHSLHLCWGTGASAGSRSERWDIQRLGSCRASLEWNHDQRWLGTLDLERKSNERWRKLPQVVFVGINLDVRGNMFETFLEWRWWCIFSNWSRSSSWLSPNILYNQWVMQCIVIHPQSIEDNQRFSKDIQRL